MALAGKWKQMGAGILLMMLLIGGALWFKGEWLSLMRRLSGASRDLPIQLWTGSTGCGA